MINEKKLDREQNSASTKSQDSTVIHSRKFPLPRRASYGVGCGSVSYCIQASILYLIETIWIHRITHIWKAQLTDGDNKNSYLLNQCCHKLNKEDVEWFSAKHFDCISFNICKNKYYEMSTFSKFIWLIFPETRGPNVSLTFIDLIVISVFR